MKKIHSLIVKMKFGSHLYGTDTPESDLDIKGVFLPSKEQVLLSKVPKNISFSSGNHHQKNTKDDVDYEFYSLHYFIKLALEGQTVAIDMLHAPPNMIIESSDIWEEIVSHRNKFYTKNLKAFIGYSRRQASKYGIKGSRLNVIQQVLDLLKSHDADAKLRTIWDILPQGEYCFEKGVDPNEIRMYQVCGKSFQESVTIGYVIPILEKYYEQYGKRAKLASQNKSIDWKAVSHAIRAAYQTKEILTENTVTFPLKNAHFISQVKQGCFDYLSEVAPVLESLMDEVEELVKHSQLPEKVDRTFWDMFICNTLGKNLFKIMS